MLLSINNLHTRFALSDAHGADVVRGVDLDIAPGEVVALVGESGCGKSVTAFSVMRLLPENARHDTGRIMFDGNNVLELSEKQTRAMRGNDIAMIFQEPMTSLNPLMKIEKQIAEPLAIHRGILDPNEAREEVLKLMRSVGIPAPDSRLADYPHQLSGGMRQRVMIAMALACRPKLLIADEPTTALDVTIQAQILGLIKDLQQETGMAVLFITHDLGVVNQIADRVYVMYAGKIMEHGTRETIFSAPKHPYTRGLFASLPIIGAPRAELTPIPGTVPPAANYPTACPFHPRCREAFNRCSTDPCPLHELETGHGCACHLLDPDEPKPRDENAWKQPEESDANSSDDTEASDDHRHWEPILHVNELKTHFPVKRGVFQRTVAHVRAVDGIDFSLGRGRTLALVGESGCGKTTVGLSVLNLLGEAAGRVVFQGRPVLDLQRSELRNIRSQMQIVFQDPFSSLSPRMTVGRIIREGLDVHMKHLDAVERHRRVVAALKEVGLGGGVFDSYPHEFSGGQRQRISIARALVLEPRFIVLDEPTSALDVSVQAQILNLLKKLQAKHGIAFLFITHDLQVVRFMANDVAVMYLGRIVEHAPVAALFENPRHPYTQSLLRALPRPDTRTELERLQGEVPSPLNPPQGCHFHPRCPVFNQAEADSPLLKLCPLRYPGLENVDDEHCVACHATRIAKQLGAGNPLP
jgi:peptide/nickel transport system ATP-binding protein